jgi:hypothetical protein
LFALAAFLTAPSFGQTAVLKIDEPQIKFRLSAHPAVEIPIVNTSGKALPGDFKLELLATDDRVVQVVTGTFQVSPGTTVERIAWPQDSLARTSPPRLGWRRLRYSFTPRSEFGVGAAQGIVQLSRVLAGIFQVRLAGASKAKPGSRYPVRLRVDDPLTGKPRRGAAVELQLTLDDDDDTTFKHALLTDNDGYAVYTFDLPKEVNAEQGTVTAEVTRGGFSERAELEFDMRVTNKVTLSTDKPLYQPGQIAHLRVLALGPDRRALANREVTIAIEDEEGNEQFLETVKTSRFGVASAEWDIPLKLRLGDYRAEAKVKGAKDEDDYDFQPASATLRVSRYELPTFTVKAEPDRKYYLPGQNARIAITAGYLFGKPVQNATVRLVRQQERHWDFKEQKWETDESDPIEGSFDKQGRFEASVDLGEDFARFDPEDQSHYEDLTFAAYVTDLSTKRTEQRRFRIRLSQQPVQLYVIGGGEWSPANEPATLYVTSSYADGQPASVNGTLYFAEPNEKGEFEEDPWQGGRSKALSFHTNRFGVGKIALPRIRERFLVRPRKQYRYYYYDNYRSAQLLFEASDGKGLRGRASESWRVSAEARYLRVTTPQTLYRPGESLAVSLESNSPVREVIVSISTPAGLVSSKVVPLVRETADVAFDYDARLRGEVEISAFSLTRTDEDDAQALSAATHVIYPAAQDLQVRLNMARTTYRPGETASADFKVRSPQGAGIESALGILVFDRAMAERVRSDEEFGRSYGFSIYDYLDDSNFGRIAGIGARDLLGLDPARPFGADLQLVAETLLYSAQYDWWSGNVQLSSGEDYTREAGSVYGPLIAKSLEPVRRALDDAYTREGRYPKNDAQLTAFLAARGVALASILDPWGRPYRTRFSVSGTLDELTFESNGADKVPGTRDDVKSNSMSWPYFRETGQLIDRIVQDYPQRTGRYIRDYATLRQEMEAKGVDPDALLDPWGHRYRFGFDVSGPNFTVTVTSAGPDGVFESAQAPSWDDVQEWTIRVRYFVAESADLQRALSERYARTNRFPQNEEELTPVLAAAKLTGERLLDPWGRPYHITFSKAKSYTDRVKISSSYDYATGKQKRVTDVVPITQELAYITISSYGPESKPEQSFNVAEFSQVLTEQAATDLARKAPATAQGPLPSGAGAITGVVTDASGAVVPGAEVTATSLTSGQSATTHTDTNGVYVFSGIQTGMYEVRVVAPGFSVWAATNVPVQLGTTTKVDATVQVLGSKQEVTVSAEAVTTLQTESGEVSAVVQKGLPGTSPVQKPLFTPRLRKYFPETLLWKPELITNGRGQAHIDFPMADNITAWSMSVIASTEAGQVGVAQKELRTFQPFFLEHDPPKVLTQGDRISLPVVLRNYSDRQQTVLTELKPESWFSILSPATQKVTVEPGGDAHAIFSFRADARVNPGKQRVTARNTDTGDAVEREIQVHPDGQEISFTTGRILAGEDRTLEVPIAQTAIAGSIDAEVRIYPNLIAHVLDAMDGIGRKPAGCAEQITSIAYVSLQAVQLLKKAGVEKAEPGDPRKQVLTDARKAVQDAFELLRTLQKPSGGFGYWQSTSENLALTAYVLRFLTDAEEFIDVDADMMARARAYLVAQQSQTGAWQRYDYWTKKQIDDPMDTAYIVRALAASETKLKGNAGDSVMKALSYLDDRIGEWSSPYLIGNYAIAAASIKHETHIANARAMLARLAHQEGPATYWNLEVNTTPFYGWGYAGRLETTALAVEALARLQALSRNPAEQEQLNRGVQYLLTHKDRYSTWYSTQATQNVLEALIAAMPPAKAGAADTSATILVNGTKVASIQLPKPDEVSGPKVIDFGKEFARGSNRVEIERTGASAALEANVIASYYVPWAVSQATREEGVKTGDTRALRLKVNFDRREIGIGEAITCRVEAERIGFRGYGMMIAEVGLPPGAEVDRESLEKARGTGVDGYEVQPDRVVFYLWPSAGGSAFEFAFRPRFAIDALSAPSLLYDYYNPEANAAVLPVRFSVH